MSERTALQDSMIRYAQQGIAINRLRRGSANETTVLGIVTSERKAIVENSLICYAW